MRRGWIKVIKQAIWGVGPGVFRSRTCQAKRRASDHRQQQHIIRYHNGRPGRTGKREGNERRTDSERGRQSSYRATESGARERKGNGCTLDHRPGHTITLRRGPPHAPSLGVGIACSLLGAVLQDRRMLPVEVLGPRCLRTLYSESHCALQAHPAVRARHSDLRGPAVRSILADRQRRCPALPCPDMCVYVCWSTT